MKSAPKRAKGLRGEWGKCRKERKEKLELIFLLCCSLRRSATIAGEESRQGRVPSRKMSRSSGRGCERGSALVALHDPAVSKLSFHKVFLVFFTFSRSVWPLRQAWSRAGGCSTFPGFVQELPGLVPIPGDAGMHRTPGSSGMSPVPILTPSRAHPLFCSSLQGRAGRRKCLCQ